MQFERVGQIRETQTSLSKSRTCFFKTTVQQNKKNQILNKTSGGRQNSKCTIKDREREREKMSYYPFSAVPSPHKLFNFGKLQLIEITTSKSTATMTLISRHRFGPPNRPLLRPFGAMATYTATLAGTRIIVFTT